jgi:hypothetical protein
MPDAIFLSAGVPDPERSPEYARTADTVAIAASVSALVHVILGRRMLVWGGHPAITPMIWTVAESMTVNYGQWVKLYQSLYFKDEYPEDNERFQNVIFTRPVSNDREKSLHAMRERMFKEQEFKTGIFIGGMRGIIDEFELFRNLQPKARTLPIVSTGGAVLDIATRLPSLPNDLRDDLDYVSLFHRHLGISTKELRYNRPSDQPFEPDERLWKPKG